MLRRSFLASVVAAVFAPAARALPAAGRISVGVVVPGLALTPMAMVSWYTAMAANFASLIVQTPAASRRFADRMAR